MSPAGGDPVPVWYHRLFPRDGLSISARITSRLKFCDEFCAEKVEQ